MRARKTIARAEELAQTFGLKKLQSSLAKLKHLEAEWEDEVNSLGKLTKEMKKLINNYDEATIQQANRIFASCEVILGLKNRAVYLAIKQSAPLAVINYLIEVKNCPVAGGHPLNLSGFETRWSAIETAYEEKLARPDRFALLQTLANAGALDKDQARVNLWNEAKKRADLETINWMEANYPVNIETQYKHTKRSALQDLSKFAMSSKEQAKDMSASITQSKRMKS